MAAVASVPVTTTEVAGISFGFYAPEEVCVSAILCTIGAHVTETGSLAQPTASGVLITTKDVLTAMPLQVSKLSVKQIVSPISLDAMSNALPGGLYDPAMGPVDQAAT